MERCHRRYGDVSTLHLPSTTLEMRTVVPEVLARARPRAASPRLDRTRREAVTLVPAQGVRVIAGYPSG